MNRAGGVHPVASAGPPPPPPPPGAVGGVRIGPYELLRRLGSGGMAEVHLARATGFEGFEKLLVLKRILPHLAADAHFRQMFLAEARLAALLQHPNIVQVYDLGKDDAEFFFTMEFVYGENAYAISRAARKRNEQVPLEVAVAITIGAASGLHYAHERVGMDGKPLGIVHRDVSPTNLMVTYDGCPKVADFGIAKITNRTDVTQAGIRKGKVPYMSPEQCKAQRVDRRSDVFALGICLYELSTGARLFDGDNEFGVMNRIVTGDVPLPSTQRSNYPKALERIVTRALSTDIDKRYPTCLHMQHDLEAFLRDSRLDGSASALAAWMHRVFKPQPFPWGALQGDGVTGGGMARPTIADSGAGLGSQPGDIISRPDMTPLSGVSSHPMPSSAHSSIMPAGPGSMPGSYASASRRTGTGIVANDGGTLKGIAMGLGIVAAIAVLSVGGLMIYKQTKAKPEVAPASVEAAPVEAAPAVQAVPTSAAEPVAAPPVEQPPEPEPEPEPAPEPAPAPEPEPEPEPAPEPEPEPAPEPEPEPELVELEDEPEIVEVIDEPKPRPKPRPKNPSSVPSNPKPKPKPKSKPKNDESGGQANPDAFWGG